MIQSIILKEFKLLFRSKNGILSMLALILTFLFIFHFTLENQKKLDVIDIIGIKWSAMFILSFIFIGQSNWEEREGDAYKINKLLLSNTVYFLSKSLTIFIALFVMEIALFFLLVVFFENYKLTTSNLYGTFLFLVPSTLTLSFLGMTLSHISFATRLKEIILPMLLIPLSIPVLLFGIEAERKFYVLGQINYFSIALIFSFCILYASLGILLMELLANEN